MKELTIQKNDAGQRLDKYLHKLLPNAANGFLYKMLRKKNITLNKKKACGNETLKIGDTISVFLSDETFAKFSQDIQVLQKEYEQLAALPMHGLSVIYEDPDILVLNKPCNMLSQKAQPQDVSANERILGHLIREGSLSFEEMLTFRPSVCNRLDRNTTGLLLAGKSLQGLQSLSDLLRSREAKKFYYAMVAGEILTPSHLRGYLKKDEQNNQVAILAEDTPEAMREDALWIETAYQPVRIAEDGTWTLLEIHLITGRSHQIRAHLASIRHPIIGDPKYGDAKINRYYRDKYGISHQLLHAHRIEFPDQKSMIAPMPKEFQTFTENGKGPERK